MEDKRAEIGITDFDTPLSASYVTIAWIDYKSSLPIIVSRHSGPITTIDTWPTTVKITMDKTKKIGEGRYGRVFHGKFNGKPVAVKRVEIPDKDREKQALLRLKHRNVVKLLYTENDIDFRFKKTSLNSMMVTQ